MRDYQREAERLARARSLVEERFPRFGVNKFREIVRLIYEISRREDIPPGAVIPSDAPDNFIGIKKYLLRQRFPRTSKTSPDFRPYLPEFDLDPEKFAVSREGPFSPRKIYIEESVRGSVLAAAFTDRYPTAERIEIPSFKEFLSGYSGRGVSEYNRRTETIFIINEERDF
ncbi:MAG: hypothetical protein U9N73_05800, partial [Candidatus Auribacterota bacterium]|nr:hypothetical protein [Candidatus Auribacterota bacterium]